LKLRPPQAVLELGYNKSVGSKFPDLESLRISDIRLEDCNVIPRQSIELGGRCLVSNNGENKVSAVGTKLCDEFKLKVSLSDLDATQ
jgi:hypothetical protein